MPCKKCESKLTNLATPDVKRDGNKCAVRVNKLIEKKTKKDKLEAKGNQCKVCKVFLHINGKYCNSCAYKQGRCHICGKKMVDVSKHLMSLV
nr:CRIPT protein [Theileria orientalis]